MRFQRRYSGAGILALTLVAGMFSQKLFHPTPNQRAIEATRSHIVDQIEPLCRALVPEQGSMRFVAVPETSYSKNGWNKQIWTADCMDEQNRHLVHVLWDNDTQHVIIISRGMYPDVSHAIPICDAQAVELARKWVKQLNLATDSEVQQSAYKLGHLGAFLNVHLYPPSGTVMVWLNKTGDIISTHTSHKSGFASKPVIAGEKEKRPDA